jgi:hypothetical protein
MKHFELVFDERYGRDVRAAATRIQLAAEVRGVPEGTKPTIDVKADPDTSWQTITTYRWEW